MTHVTKFTPHNALGRLEAKKGHRYNYGDISKIMGDDRQKIRYQLSKPVIEIKTTMIDQWLDFFAHEGMPITVADLFTVTTTEQPPPAP